MTFEEIAEDCCSLIATSDAQASELVKIKIPDLCFRLKLSYSDIDSPTDEQSALLNKALANINRIGIQGLEELLKDVIPND